MTAENRLPPEIILVPPPPGPGMPRERIRGIVCVCILGGVLCFGVLTLQGLGNSQCVKIMGCICAGASVVLAASFWWINRCYQTQRRTFLRQHPSGESDPRAGALATAWKEADRVPKLADVRAALADVVAEQNTNRACLVCYGEADVPEVGELHFEPEIITPTGAVRRQLIWLVIAGALIAWCLFDYINLLPSWLPGARPLMGGLMYFFAAGAIALSVWVWRGMIRPTYVRLAPGVIQVLVYPLSNRQPIIRSYPMEPGTLAILTRIRKRLILTLSRGENTDVLSFSRMDHPQQRIDQTWRALLSTAPTPPLSDDKLVG